MRIIHTSDWHLGQNFYTKSRASEHQAFFDWLLNAALRHQVDAIIVAGDIFDTGSPPSYARKMFNRFVVQLHSTGCQLVVLGGNHDSVATLNESLELMACLNTQVIASARQHDAGQARVLHKKDGSPGAILCPVPFLRPRDIQSSEAGLSVHEKQRALTEAISEHYQQCYDAAVALRGNLSLPIVVTGHLTTVGATKSEAVRDIYIGTLDAFPAQRFPPADYIALGHIHRAQKIGGSEHIRYSGSPIPLSFDETGKAKSVYLVTFSGGALESVEPLDVPISQPLAIVRGSLREIAQQLEQWRNAPASPKVWLDIEITADGYLHEIQRQIQALTDDLPVEVILLRRSREQRERIIASQHKETLSELSVEEVFERRLSQEEICVERAARVRTLFAQTLSALHQQEDQA